jgi:hypothetical protein
MLVQIDPARSVVDLQLVAAAVVIHVASFGAGGVG